MELKIVDMRDGQSSPTEQRPDEIWLSIGLIGSTGGLV